MTQKKLVKVAAALIIADGRMLAAKRGPGRALAGFWELPGGKIENGENGADTCVREVKEELDCEIVVDQYLLTQKYEYETFSLEMQVFRCRLIHGTKPRLQEHLALQWADAAECDALNWAPADVAFLPRLKAELN